MCMKLKTFDLAHKEFNVIITYIIRSKKTQ